MEPIVRPPDIETKRYIVYIVRLVGHDSVAYTREYWANDKEDAIRVALDYYASGKRVAVCEEKTIIKTVHTLYQM